jgi:DNA/RNA endonuclease YhcR with UshA esterase domain
VFTAVVFSSNTNRFPDLEKLQGKTVEVTGKITEYRARPQIVLLSTNQLKVIEKEAKEPKK